MTERGNKGMKILTIYVEPDKLKRFKARCVMEGTAMTVVLNEFINSYIGEKRKKK